MPRRVPPPPPPPEASTPSDAAPPPSPPRARRRGRGGDDDDRGVAGVCPPSGRRGGAKPAPSASLDDDDDAALHMNSVVKIYATHAEPNFSLPWQRKRPMASSSSGVIIPGARAGELRVITNAHSVDYATLVKVRRRGDDRKYVATVDAVGPECDLALLSVADPDFWVGLAPVAFGALAPRVQSAVTVVGFPVGGDGLCVTSGICSRCECTAYVHASAELLSAQTDSAINSGASGGAAFDKSGRCIGIAFQSMAGSDVEATGYIIPIAVVTRFLRDVDANGRFSGFPSIGVDWQKLELASTRRWLGMDGPGAVPGAASGVLVRRVEPTAPAAAVLRRGDVLLAFDGVPLANDGTVPLRAGERVAFSYLVSNKFVGDTATVRILRGRRVMDVAVPLAVPHKLVPVHTAGAAPSYFVFGGCVFTPATVPLLKGEYGRDWEFEAPVKLLDLLVHGQPQRPGQQIVLLAQVLPCAATLGIEDVANTAVKTVNGAAVHNLASLVAAVDGAVAAGREFVELELEYAQTIVLSTADSAAATAQVMAAHCIPADRSADLVAGGGGGGGGRAARKKARK